MAMGSKIFPHLALENGGTTVKVKGPVGEWDPYAVSATFAVIVGQVHRQTGAITLAKGRSTKTYTPGDDWWGADADVIDPAGGVLVPGMAVAWGIAAVEMQDGRHETFEWSVTTRLIDSPPLP
jgi:hypothetical protein